MAIGNVRHSDARGRQHDIFGRGQGTDARARPQSDGKTRGASARSRPEPEKSTTPRRAWHSIGRAAKDELMKE